MQYITHHFAHPETLQLARRWLVQLGFDPCQIETHTDGIPRIAIAVEPNRVAEAEMVINAAEQTDPDAWPSFWDMARQEHVYPAMTGSHDAPEVHPPHRQAVGWHPQVDVAAEGATLTEVWHVDTQFE